MFTDQTVAFIGGGIMGEAMIRGLITRDIVAPEQIIAADPMAERLDDLRGRYGIRVTVSNAEAAESGQVIVLSIKPQNLGEVMPGIRGHLRRQDLLLSILAGTPIRKLADGVAHAAVVRAMPNTPAQIGQGMTVWTATPEVTPEQRAQAQAILGALGVELFVGDEGYLDMATALSGTGPAYIFMFMEALVASPGGTTAAALYHLEKGGLRTVLSRAIWAAYQRSVELGQGEKVKGPSA